MLNYHFEKGTLPVLPGDYVYRIGTDHACTVRAVKVDAVILRGNDQITAKVNNEYGESEFGNIIIPFGFHVGSRILEFISNIICSSINCNYNI